MKFQHHFHITPVPSNGPKHTRRGIAYTPTNVRNFKKEFMRELVDLKSSFWTTDDPIKARVIFYFARPKSSKRKHPTVKPDIDNCLKSVFDCLKGVIFRDDCQIVDVHATKSYWTQPGIYVELSVIDK